MTPSLILQYLVFPRVEVKVEWTRGEKVLSRQKKPWQLQRAASALFSEVPGFPGWVSRQAGAPGCLLGPPAGDQIMDRTQNGCQPKSCLSLPSEAKWKIQRPSLEEIESWLQFPAGGEEHTAGSCLRNCASAPRRSPGLMEDGGSHRRWGDQRGWGPDFFLLHCFKDRQKLASVTQ